MPSVFQRDLVNKLVSRMRETRRYIQVVSGPRQTGKTTSILQALDQLADIPHHFIQAGSDTLSTRDWLRREWQNARSLAKDGVAILAIDEIQLVSKWSEVVKDLWDEDTRNELQLHVILSGSSSLLLQKGLREGLTGRFEELFCYQWSLSECKQAFGFSLDDYLYFGGYPGAAPLISDEARWLDYMKNSIIAPSVMKDVIAMDKVTKPALMDALFTLGSSYSAQEISFRKLLGQLDDAGNATTIAHYLSLLGDAGLLAGLQKYNPKPLKQRASSPRLIAFDTSLMVANYGQFRKSLLVEPDRRGHLVECAVGASLLKRGIAEHFDVYWWRDGSDEVDFVLSSGEALTAIEVKSGRVKSLRGLDAFCSKYPVTKSIVIGASGVSLESFLNEEVALF